MSLEGMIWITRTGAPSKEFGNWNTVHRRFRRWAQSGVFQRIFEVVEEDLDLKTVNGTFAPPTRRWRLPPQGAVVVIGGGG